MRSVSILDIYLSDWLNSKKTYLNEGETELISFKSAKAPFACVWKLNQMLRISIRQV